MISLHIAKLLADEGFGTLDTDIFWEEAPLDQQGNPREGVWVVTRGAAVDRLTNGYQAFDIYARYANKLTTHQKLEDILEYLKEAFSEVCDLPLVPPYSMERYIDCSIQPTSSVDNVGTDENEKIVKVISGEIRYKKES